MSAASVAIVNWNGEDLLPACLASVREQASDLEVETIVVDNGSTDRSLELLARDWPAVRVLRNSVNNYAGANNLALEASAFDRVLLLNSDAQIERHGLRCLVEALDARPDAAAVMPKVVYPDGRLYTTGVVEREDLYWLDRDHAQRDGGQRDRPEELFAVSGCCVLLAREKALAAGGLDEDFHMYYEDVEFSLRLRERGWRLLYEPRARVRHVGHATIDRLGPAAKDPLGERNRLLVLARHYRERFAGECVRSPWFQSASPEELRWLLERLATRLSGTPSEALLELLVMLRGEVRAHAGEIAARWGQHANLPKVLDEREGWIAMLLREVRRLRVWRWPTKRLKPAEKAFLERFEARRRSETL